ncbi:MAG TPA: hypothetical protein VIY86_00715, partial [Pirellulaceae bacterium]
SVEESTRVARIPQVARVESHSTSPAPNPPEATDFWNGGRAQTTLIRNWPGVSAEPPPAWYGVIATLDSPSES